MLREEILLKATVTNQSGAEALSKARSRRVCSSLHLAGTGIGSPRGLTSHRDLQERWCQCSSCGRCWCVRWSRSVGSGRIAWQGHATCWVGVEVVLFPPNLAASEGDRHPALHSSLSSQVWFWLHSHPQFGSWGSANEGVGSGGSLPKRGSRAQEGPSSSARSWEAWSELRGCLRVDSLCDFGQLFCPSSWDWRDFRGINAAGNSQAFHSDTK